jgi:hypothetical protein
MLVYSNPNHWNKILSKSVTWKKWQMKTRFKGIDTKSKLGKTCLSKLLEVLKWFETRFSCHDHWALKKWSR